MPLQIKVFALILQLFPRLMGDSVVDHNDEYVVELYHQLRNLASRLMANERAGQTMQATALVHEAFLRLSQKKDGSWNGANHFYGAAAEAMRRILVENARKKASLKRGGEFSRVDLDGLNLAINAENEQVLALNDALTRLEARDPTGAQLVKLRFFSGLKNAEVAEVLGISERTAKRQWTFVRAWLYEEMRKNA